MSKISKPILEVKNLVKKFGDFTAVDGISFEIKEGEILGFLGPNGAGKSTTINCLLGAVKPDGGEIKVFGKELFGNRSEIMKQVNYCSAEFNTGWHLRVNEALLVYCKLYEVKNPKARIDEVLEIFEAKKWKNKPVRELSFGQRARINMCKALLNKPRLLLLDEPMASMDPDVVDRGIAQIKKIQRETGISILYTSHNMWEIEQVADEVVFVNHGKVIAKGSPLALTQQYFKKETKEPNLREVFIELSRGEDILEGNNELI
ncbi:ABC transporter ATP-binding protein [Candidatus Curtissbacteria bacterium]|nr:ABC transporter ATP-binding protein [Candidatus Curtissbacteria bacterium]